MSLTTIKRLLPGRRNKDLHELFTKAYYVFEDWPHKYYQFLRQWNAQQRSSTFGYQRLHSVLYKNFGKLYAGLYDKLTLIQSRFLRDAFVNYLIEEWEGCDLSSFIKGEDTGKHKVKYVSKSDATRLLDSDDRWINYFIDTGQLKMKVRSKGMKRLIFIDVADIAKLVRESSLG
jgi:hypothetical protein